VTKTQSTRG